MEVPSLALLPPVYSSASSLEVDGIRSVSPVFPTVPVAIDSGETCFLSVPTGGVSAVVPIAGKIVEGKILMSKGALLPTHCVPAHSVPAYSPFLLKDGQWLICRPLIKNAPSKDISFINIHKGTVFTKKRLLYEYAAPAPSGDIILLGMQSIAFVDPDQIMTNGVRCAVIYTRTDGKMYPSMQEYTPLVAWPQDMIGTIAPDKHSFEILKKKGEQWQLLHTVAADKLLSDVTWGKEKACAVSMTGSVIQFYDLLKGESAGKIACPNIGSKCLFMHNDAILVCGISSACPALAIIGCADLKNPELLAEIPLDKTSHDIDAERTIAHMVALKDHVLIKTVPTKANAKNKSYAVGPIYSGAVKKYLIEQEKKF